MDMPSDEELETASLWLKANEGVEFDEAIRCKAVAEWLEFMRRERYLRRAARDAGVPVARLRRKLAEQAQASSLAPSDLTHT